MVPAERACGSQMASFAFLRVAWISKFLKIFTGYPAPFCLDATEYVRWSLKPLEGLSILPFYTINLSEALWVAFRPF